MNLYLDIETIPTQDEATKIEIAANIHPPGNIKKPESIQKWFAENEEAEFEKAYRKTALIGTVGEIVCISWAVGDGEIHHVYRDVGGNEAVMLANFMLQLQKSLIIPNTDKLIKPVWIGHYVTGFDLRFLWQRYVINGVIPLIPIPYNARPWDKDVYDTKIEWAGTQSTGYGSLDMLSRVLGQKGKGDIDGSKVWDAILDGRIMDVVEYCDDDVERVRGIHKCMTFQAA